MKQVDVKFKGRYNNEWDLDYDGDFYIYNQPEGMELIPGDYVVVETRYGLSLALVLQVREEKEPANVKMKIVTKVEGYNFVDEENRKKRKEELKQKIQTFEKSLAEREKYNLIIKAFPEAEAVINEYLSL